MVNSVQLRAQYTYFHINACRFLAKSVVLLLPRSRPDWANGKCLSLLDVMRDSD